MKEVETQPEAVCVQNTENTIRPMGATCTCQGTLVVPGVFSVVTARGEGVLLAPSECCLTSPSAQDILPAKNNLTSKHQRC